MTNLIAALFRLLESFLDHLETQRLKRERQQHQDTFDEIQQNPGDYANGKFGAERLRKPKAKTKRVRDSDTGTS